MQYVSIYERTGNLAEQIMDMEFWSNRSDFSLNKNVQREPEKLMEELQKQKPDILILVADSVKSCDPRWVEMIRDGFSGIHMIVIGTEADYELVRAYFLAGVFDYLIQPLNMETLKTAILRVYTDFGIAYVVNELSMKVDALIDNIFLGGGEEPYIIKNIMEQIYTDWKRDPLNCQIVSDKAKKHI